MSQQGSRSKLELWKTGFSDTDQYHKDVVVNVASFWLLRVRLRNWGGPALLGNQIGGI